jgi:CubicO group peptidase (beta-lactamase class C family)
MFVLSLFGFLQLMGCCVHQIDWSLQPGAGDPEIQAILRKVSRLEKIVGMGAGIVRPTGDADIAVVGWNKAGEETPIGLNDLWHICSCSKAMTATLAAKLIEEGKLQWHTTLAEVFPKVAERLDPDKRDITLEQLLSHRSGLCHSPSLHLYYFNRWGSPAGQRKAVLRHLSGTKLVGPPGGQASYSNFGYILAGAMIEQVTGLPFEDVMHTRLFKPLDMLGAEFEGTRPYGTGGVLWPHKTFRCPTPRWMVTGDPPFLSPAGGVRCSLGDWARFLRQHLVGETGGSGYLQAETFRELHRSHGDNSALGWGVHQQDGADGTELGHIGSNGLNLSIVSVAPQKGFAVFVCANQGGCGKSVREVFDRLVDLASN